MASHYFIANNENLNTVYNKLLLWFKIRQYDVEGIESTEDYFIQARKTGLIRTFTGTNLAFKVKIYWSKHSHNREFVIETTTGKWISNLAGAGFASMFTGGITVLTGLGGAAWTLIVENNMIEYVETALKCQRIKPETAYNPDVNTIKTEPINNTINLCQSSRQKAQAKVAQELQKLEKAHQEGILDKVEYNAKKTTIEATVERYEIEFTVEEQMNKLEKAFIEGILSEQEYEAKIANVWQNVEEEILNERFQEQKQEHLQKLKQALEQGILSQAEYDAKVANLYSK
ncbi:MAG: hypothetical protein Tsb0014_14740 [Pleurocapsa sp.]